MVVKGKIALGLLACTCATVFAEDARGPKWPQFLGGAGRDSTSGETEILKSWPAGGPRLLWTASGLGEAASTIIVSGGTVYTAGKADANVVLIALDAAGGAIRWKEPVAHGGGPTATPSIAGGRLFFQYNGVIHCRDAASGRAIWTANVMAAVEKAAGATAWRDRTRYGSWHSSPVVAGGKVYMVTGRPDALVAAFGAADGKLLWTSRGSKEASSRGWSSPMVVRAGRRDLVIALSAWYVTGLDANSGEVFWEREVMGDCGGRRAGNSLCSVPAWHEGRLHCTTGYGPVTQTTFDVTDDGRKIAPAWHNPAIHPFHEGTVVVGGMLFGTGDVAWDDLRDSPGLLVNGRPAKEFLAKGQVAPKVPPADRGHNVIGFTDPNSGERRQTGLVCQDFKTGKVLGVRIEFDAKRGGFKGYMMAVAGGMIHAAFSDDMDRVLLIEAAPAMAVRGLLPVEWRKEEHGKFPLIHTSNGLFSAPVVCGGRLYLRLRDRLLCYDVKAP